MDSVSAGSRSSSVGAGGRFGPGGSPSGLKLGKRLYVEDGSGGSSSSRASGSRKGAGQQQQQQQQQQKPPRCQVEGCNEDLTGVKAYYCKHKVCGMHSKSPKVIVGGLEQRFCQQCSRFHQLPEFDQGKRSCRRRLAGHNERRRKPPLSSLSSRYGRLSSSFRDGGSFGGFLLDFTHSRLQSVGNHWQGSPTIPQPSRILAQGVQPQSPITTAGTLFPNQEAPPDGSFSSSDSSCALSLLSTQPWGANTIVSSRGPAISGHRFEGALMAHSSAVSTYSSSSPFKGQEISAGAYDVPCEMGLGLTTDPVNRQFSGEVEMAVQGNGQCLNHGHGRAYGPSGNVMHWAL